MNRSRVVVRTVTRGCSVPVEVRVGVYLTEATLRSNPSLKLGGARFAVATTPKPASEIELFQGRTGDISELLYGGVQTVEGDSIKSIGKSLVEREIPKPGQPVSSTRKLQGTPNRVSTAGADSVDPGDWLSTPPPGWDRAPFIEAYGAVFRADWTYPGTRDSCYLALPELVSSSDDMGFSTGMAVWQELASVRPVKGEYDSNPFKNTDSSYLVIAPGRGMHSLEPNPELSFNSAWPPPDDAARINWTCDVKFEPNPRESRTTDRFCGSLIPYKDFEASNSWNSSQLFRGVAIGLLSAIFVEAVLRIPRRRSTAKQE